ncbi:MAG TPA: ligase-associated DNA damage response exonuclease [Puia sp.]|jgi:putative mRNA 3-end processing factor|nr:ligase-associated DNA damage response exonuclease [Puia sp.]
MPLIESTENGLYCAQGQFYIDPWRPVDKAVITHAHSDHARAGSASYLCHRLTLPLLELRLGPHAYQAVEWGEVVYLNGVRVSLHPAGHIIGSSQVRVEHRGEVWVASGDYKTEDDGLSGAFEAVPCHVFITESTFGLPIYNWKPQPELLVSMEEWVRTNAAKDRTSVLIAYSLGKAQRVLAGLAHVVQPIYLHGAVYNVHTALQRAGIPLPEALRVMPDMPKGLFRGKLVIAPPGAEGSSWMRRFGEYALGICSGWMQVRGNVRRRNADAGFAMSDHADWKGLLAAVDATGAERLLVTHGFQAVLARYLSEKGIEAGEVRTEYGEDEETAGAATEESDSAASGLDSAAGEGGLDSATEEGGLDSATGEGAANGQD